MADRIEVGIGLRDQLTRDLQKSVSGIRRFVRTGTSAFKRLGREIFSVRGLIGGLVTGVAIKRLNDLVRSTVDLADQTGKLSTRLGVSTEFLSEMGFVADRSNIPINQMNVGLQRLTRRLSEFQRTGAGTAQRGLEILGLEDAASDVRDITELLPLLADRFQQLGDSPKAVEAAFSLFDSEGVSFLQFLKEGGEGIEEMRREARALGIVFDRETTQSAARFNDAMTNLSASFRGLRQQAILPVIPLFEDLAREATAFLQRSGPEIVEILRLGFSAVADSLRAIIPLLRELAPLVKRVAEPLRFAAFAVAAGNPAGAVQRLIGDATGQLRGRRGGGPQTALGQLQRRFGTPPERTQADLEFEGRIAAARFRGGASQGVFQSIGQAPVAAARGLATAFREATDAIATFAEREKVVVVETERVATALDGAADAARVLKDETSNFNQARQAVLGLAFSIESGIGQAISDIVLQTRSWKDAFRNAAKSILSDISRIITQMLLLRTISAAVQGIGGLFSTGGPTLSAGQTATITQGFTSTTSPAAAGTGATIGLGPNFHEGGVVPGPRGRPRLITALGGERFLRTGQNAGGSGGVVVNLAVTNDITAVDAASFDARWRQGLLDNFREVTERVATRIATDPSYRRRVHG